MRDRPTFNKVSTPINHALYDHIHLSSVSYGAILPDLLPAVSVTDSYYLRIHFSILNQDAVAVS